MPLDYLIIGTSHRAMLAGTPAAPLAGDCVAGGRELRRPTSVAGKPGDLKAIAQSINELRAEWPGLPCD